MPSAMKAPQVLPEPAPRPVPERKKLKLKSVSLPVFKLPGQEGSRQAECHACHKTKEIPNTRRRLPTCDDCFKNGGDNVMMQGVDKAQIAAWVGAHCPGGAEDLPFATSARRAFLGDDAW